MFYLLYICLFVCLFVCLSVCLSSLLVFGCSTFFLTVIRQISFYYILFTYHHLLGGITFTCCHVFTSQFWISKLNIFFPNPIVPSTWKFRKQIPIHARYKYLFSSSKCNRNIYFVLLNTLGFSNVWLNDLTCNGKVNNTTIDTWLRYWKGKVFVIWIYSKKLVTHIKEGIPYCSRKTKKQNKKKYQL